MPSLIKSDNVSEVLALVKWRAGGDDSDDDGDDALYADGGCGRVMEWDVL